jgi:predicted  nucleic acid-binding Zn-ribbon protein
MTTPMPSEAGTEDRLNALEEALRPLPEQLGKVAAAVDHLTEEIKVMREQSREDFIALRDEMAGLRGELREDVQSMREEGATDRRALQQDFSALQGRLTQIGFGLVGGLIAVVITVLLA